MRYHAQRYCLVATDKYNNKEKYHFSRKDSAFDFANHNCDGKWVTITMLLVEGPKIIYDGMM